MSVSTASGILQHRPFVLFWLARLASTIGYHMLVLAVGWQIYAITNSAYDLGMVGLIQFIPAVVLTLLVGHAADRYDRRLIVRAAQSVHALAALMITAALLTGLLSRDLLFVAVFMMGCGRAFEMPAAHSLAPTLVPGPLVSRAVAAWTSANQIAVISGPALGGLIFTVSPVLVGVICVVFFTISIVLITFVKAQGPPPSREPTTFASVLAGFEYVRSRHRLLGVITLDLFVVLLGGVTGLLPIFAKDILAVGPIGLGLLRSAPAAGALVTAAILSRYPVERHIGRKMFTVVAIYGVTTIVFGLSTWFPLSLFALACLGASDALSVVIRFSLVQIETPDEKRGRVSAINYLLVGSSNTLGEFESGMVAGWLGAVPSVLIGGVGSLLVAGVWMGLFPDLRRIDRFEPADEKEDVMHILMTGAAGMIGRKLTARLVKDGRLNGQTIDRLTLIDVVAPEKPTGFNGAVELSTGDLAASGNAIKLVATKPDVIFHLAGVVSGEAETDFEKGYHVNLDGTRALLEAIRAVGNGYKPKVVFTSSIAVYGAPFPYAIPDEFHLTPLTSYGTQKAISELLLADYTRRGFLDGVGIRLPTICVRPGKPNKAASGFFSGIIREPLAGLEAVLPVADGVRHTHASPRAAIGFLIHAAGLTREQLGPRVSLAMPGVCCTVAEQIESLARIAGPKVAMRIRREPDELIMRIVSGWSERIDAKRAAALGFKAEATFDDIIRAHIEDELGGKIT